MSGQSLPSILVPRFLLDERRDELEAAVGDRAQVLADDDPSLEDPPSTIEVVVTGIDEEIFDRVLTASKVRWVHSISAGVEHLPLDQMAERGVLLTNSAGAYATAMAEYVLGAMIMHAPASPVVARGPA